MSKASTKPHHDTPQPGPHEAYADFVRRAHAELMPRVPDPAERNALVWGAWAYYNGDEEHDRARQLFESQDHVYRPNRPLFQEHERTVPGKGGKDVTFRFAYDDLARITNTMNDRIADTDAFPALIDKHTKPASKDDSPAENRPKAVGYVGPFRLGMIGRKKPRFAMFADEHHRKDAAETLRNRPRRSVEVLKDGLTGETIIDPVAALSEAPYLPLPVQFQGEEEIVLRYEAMAPSVGMGVPASPGGSNTFIAKFRNGADDEPDETKSEPAEPKTMALQPEDVRQVIDAFLATPQMQFVTQQMQKATPMPGANPGAPPAAPAPASPPAAGAPPHPPAAPSAAPPHAPQPGQSGNPMKFEAMESEEFAVRYAAMEQATDQLIEENKMLRAKLEEAERIRSDATRKERIAALYQQYPSFINVDEECSICLYANGSDMEDEDFETHVTRLESYAKRAPVAAPMLPAGVAGGERPTAKALRYQADVGKLGQKIFNEARDAGKPITWNDAWNQACVQYQQQ